MSRKPRVDRSPEEKWQIVQEGITHDSQYPLAIYRKVFLSSQPPRDAAISIGRFLTARDHDLLIVASIRPTASRPLPVVQTSWVAGALAPSACTTEERVGPCGSC